MAYQNNWPSVVTGYKLVLSVRFFKSFRLSLLYVSIKLCLKKAVSKAVQTLRKRAMCIGVTCWSVPGHLYLLPPLLQYRFRSHSSHRVSIQHFSTSLSIQYAGAQLLVQRIHFNLWTAHDPFYSFILSYSGFKWLKEPYVYFNYLSSWASIPHDLFSPGFFWLNSIKRCRHIFETPVKPSIKRHCSICYCRRSLSTAISTINHCIVTILVSRHWKVYYVDEYVPYHPRELYASLRPLFKPQIHSSFDVYSY